MHIKQEEDLREAMREREKTPWYHYFHSWVGTELGLGVRKTVLLLAMCNGSDLWLYCYLATWEFFFFFFFWCEWLWCCYWVLGKNKIILFKIFLKAKLFVFDKIGWLDLIFTISNFCCCANFCGLVYFVLHFKSIDFFNGIYKDYKFF